MSYGLTPRPQLPPEELAALVAALEEVLREEKIVIADQVPNWRFSGRWFNAAPFTDRRPRLS
ncbi:MAG TPA: hypothetical protein VNT80_02275 [Acidimicrobiales bacterium]|nr:hypothetical protein [Acidimicrobiales bacterium]